MLNLIHHNLDVVSYDIQIVFMALYLAQGRILELAVFFKEDFCSLIISVTVAKRTSGHSYCEIVWSPGLFDVSRTYRRAKSQS